MTGAAGLAAGMLLGGGGFGDLACKMGAVAAVGGLAYSAWQNYQKNQQGGAAPLGRPSRTRSSRRRRHAYQHEELGKTLVRAMIAAAKADGQIDADEKEAHLQASSKPCRSSSEEKAFVFDELSIPLDINAVVARADTPEHAAGNLCRLARRHHGRYRSRARLSRCPGFKLKLAPALVAEIHKAAGHDAPSPSSSAATSTRRPAAV